MKLASKIAVLAVIAAALAISRHEAKMESGMGMDEHRPAACLSSCLSAGNASAPAAAVFFGLAALAFVVCVLVSAGFAPVGAQFLGGLFHKDRHRYLMKVAVMPR